jgi:hypothetical protein
MPTACSKSQAEVTAGEEKIRRIAHLLGYYGVNKRIATKICDAYARGFIDGREAGQAMQPDLETVPAQNAATAHLDGET